MNGAQEAVPKEVEGNSETISEGKAGNISLPEVCYNPSMQRQMLTQTAASDNNSRTLRSSNAASRRAAILVWDYVLFQAIHSGAELFDLIFCIIAVDGGAAEFGKAAGFHVQPG